MTYCARCGKPVKESAVMVGKLSYHGNCYETSEIAEVKEVSAREARQEQKQLKAKEFHERVKYINQNRIESELRTLDALISMTNTPPLRLVK